MEKELFLSDKEAGKFFCVTKDKILINDLATKSNEDIISVNAVSHVAGIRGSKVVTIEKRGLIVRDLLKKSEILEFELKTYNDITCCDISPDNLLVILGRTDGRIVIISLIGGKMLAALPIFKGELISNVVAGEKGVFYISCKNSIRVLSGIDKKVVARIEDSSNITFVKAEGERIVFANENGELKYYSLVSKEVDKTFKHIPAKVLDVEVSHDGKRVFILTEDGVYVHKSREPLEQPSKIKVDHHTESIINLIPENRVLLTNQFEEYENYDYVEKEAESLNVKTESSYSPEDSDELTSNQALTGVDRKVVFMTVDDSATMRLIVKRAINDNIENAEVLEAEDGIAAMKVLKKRPDVDVMFLDWNMPNMNGEEVVDAVNDSKKYPNLNIIMATTEGVKEKVRKMVAKGVKGYLVKPFSPKSILEVSEKMANYLRKVK